MSELIIAEIPTSTSSLEGLSISTILLVVIILLMLIIIGVIIFSVLRSGRNINNDITNVITNATNTLNTVDCLALNVQKTLTAGCNSGLIQGFAPNFCANPPAPCVLPQ